MDDPLDGLLIEVAALPVPASRPAITLSYAQTLDGCIATAGRQPLAISGPAAQALTHRLRSAHDAILIGVGTVLADNPRLTVRLVEGPDPYPIVLDSQARTPPGAQLLRGPRPAWILTGPDAPPERLRRLEEAGAHMLTIESSTDGRLDLPAAFSRLYAAGLRRIMIEGGAAVIASSLRARLVDLIILTVSPRWESGLPALNGDGVRLGLEAPRWMSLDADGIVWGRPAWQAR
jgi:3,4-dihydroxy 2-butanone 4-phosphate synthase/GTP cyclohydrolase II